MVSLFSALKRGKMKASGGSVREKSKFLSAPVSGIGWKIEK